MEQEGKTCQSISKKDKGAKERKKDKIERTNREHRIEGV